MAINISFYFNHSHPLTVNKKITQTGTTFKFNSFNDLSTGDLGGMTTTLGVTSINDSLYYFLSGSNSITPQINYLKLSVGSGKSYYYYVTNIRASNNNTFYIDLELDVLMTYSSAIGNMTVLLDRSNAPKISDVPDANVRLSNSRKLEQYDFDKQFSMSISDGKYIMITNQIGYKAVNK